MSWSPRQARFPLTVLALLSTLLIGLVSVAPLAAAGSDPSAPTAVVSPAVVSAAVISSADDLAPAPRLMARRSPAASMWRMRRLVNAARAVPQVCGDTVMPAAPPIRRNKRLDRAARAYAQKMARRDWFAHDAPNGTGPGKRISDRGYEWSRWGENIAAGYDAVPDVIAGWLASPGHCRTLMGPYRHLGLGYAYAKDSTFGHYWVQDFASSR